MKFGLQLREAAAAGAKPSRTGKKENGNAGYGLSHAGADTR